MCIFEKPGALCYTPTNYTHMNNIQLTVAIADDHSLMRNTLATFLLNEGYNVILQAGNGQHLLDQLIKKDRLPDICLLDVEMPVMDGYETACYLRTHYPSIRILAITVFLNDKKKEKMLDCGAHGFISKTGEPEEWKNALREVWEKGE